MILISFPGPLVFETSQDEGFFTRPKVVLQFCDFLVALKLNLSVLIPNPFDRDSIYGCLLLSNP